jgi:hypothetical protein
MEYEGEESWQMSTKLCLALFILGFFFPPLWALALFAKNSQNEHTNFWFRSNMIALFIFVFSFYVAFWITLLVLMNFKDKNGQYPYYDMLLKSHIQPGEYVAMVFVPTLGLIILWEFIKNSYQLFNFKRLRKKLITTAQYGQSTTMSLLNQMSQ